MPELHLNTSEYSSREHYFIKHRIPDNIKRQLNNDQQEQLARRLSPSGPSEDDSDNHRKSTETCARKVKPDLSFDRSNILNAGTGQNHSIVEQACKLVESDYSMDIVRRSPTEHSESSTDYTCSPLNFDQLASHFFSKGHQMKRQQSFLRHLNIRFSIHNSKDSFIACPCCTKSERTQVDCNRENKEELYIGPSASPENLEESDGIQKSLPFRQSPPSRIKTWIPEKSQIPVEETLTVGQCVLAQKLQISLGKPRSVLKDGRMRENSVDKECSKLRSLSAHTLAIFRSANCSRSDDSAKFTTPGDIEPVTLGSLKSSTLPNSDKTQTALTRICSTKCNSQPWPQVHNPIKKQISKTHLFVEKLSRKPVLPAITKLSDMLKSSQPTRSYKNQQVIDIRQYDDFERTTIVRS